MIEFVIGVVNATIEHFVVCIFLIYFVIYIAISSILSTISGCCGCNQSKDVPPPIPIKEPSKTNPKREEVGLKIIMPDWYLYRVQFNAEDWFILQKKDYSKRIQYDKKGNLLWEADYYSTGRKVVIYPFDEDLRDTIFEKVTLTYNYLTRKYSVHYSGDNPLLIDKPESLFIELIPDEYTTNTVEVIKILDDTLEKVGIERQCMEKTTMNKKNYNSLPR